MARHLISPTGKQTHSNQQSNSNQQNVTKMNQKAKGSNKLTKEVAKLRNENTDLKIKLVNMEAELNKLRLKSTKPDKNKEDEEGLKDLPETNTAFKKQQNKNTSNNNNNKVCDQKRYDQTINNLQRKLEEAEEIADTLFEKLQKANDSKPTTKKEIPSTSSKTSWGIPKSVVKHVIGKGGKTIKRLQTELGVKITLDAPSKHHHSQLITIAGSEESTKQGVDYVLKIVDKYYENRNSGEQTTVDKKTEQCKYFAKGKCRYGPKCNYSHTKVTTTNRWSPLYNQE